MEWLHSGGKEHNYCNCTAFYMTVKLPPYATAGIPESFIYFQL